MTWFKNLAGSVHTELAVPLAFKIKPVYNSFVHLFVLAVFLLYCFPLYVSKRFLTDIETDRLDFRIIWSYNIYVFKM